jgi:hypothetical protein
VFSRRSRAISSRSSVVTSSPRSVELVDDASY